MHLFRRRHPITKPESTILRTVAERDSGCVWCKLRWHPETHVVIFHPVLCWRLGQPYAACEYHEHLFGIWQYPIDKKLRQTRNEMAKALDEYLEDHPFDDRGLF